jgi:hypothetical protein
MSAAPKRPSISYYQLKLIPPVAPPPPFAPPAPPKKTGSSFFPVSVAAHAPSNNDTISTKSGAESFIPVTDESAILSAVNILNYVGKVDCKEQLNSAVASRFFRVARSRNRHKKLAY